MIESMANVGSAEEVEFVDDDVESADLYEGSFSLAFGTCNLLREIKLHLKKGKMVCLGQQTVARPHSCGQSQRKRWRASPSVMS